LLSSVYRTYQAFTGLLPWFTVFQLSAVLHPDTFTPECYFIDEHFKKTIQMINIMNTAENLFLSPDEIDNEGNLHGLKTAGGLLKDFKQAIGLLLLLSTLVTLVIHLFVPGVY
jgi:hypothetical protein